MKKTITILTLLIAAQTAFSQNVGIGTTTPDASAQLEVNASTKGILIPRVALTASNIAAPVAAPANGLLLYNTATAGSGATAVAPGFYYWNAGTWVKMLGGTESLWYSMNTLAPATDINDDIYRFQRVTIGNVGSPSYNARLHVDVSSFFNLGFVVSGVTNASAAMPNIGAGSRLMYFPGKAAFRSGTVTAAQWDNANTGQYSSAMGFNTVAAGQYSFAVGRASLATGQTTFAVGDSANASNSYSMAIGTLTKASGFASVAAGASMFDFPFSSTSYSYSNASGAYSTALAGGTAGGGGSFSAGYGSVASSSGDFAIGLFSVASGGYCFAGPASTASGYSSLALNGGISAGSNSNAIGSHSAALGNQSTAVGVEDTARADYAVAMGYGTYARAYRSFAIGIYNDSVATSSPTTNIITDPLFIIGNGTARTSRSNALVVYKNANVDINGYTQLGNTAPAIKMKKLIVSIPATQGAFNFVALGLNQAKILSISGLATVAGGYQIIPNHEQGGYKYTLNVDNGNIAVGAVAGNSASVLNAPVKILVVYEE